jgi:predicted dehydrogenase
MNQQKKVKVLIVGAGRIAGLNETDDFRKKPCTHMGAYREHPGFEVLGVVDQNLELAQQFAQIFGLQAFQDLETALEHVKPDHVSVAVPYQYHHDIVIICASSNHSPKSIFCEKPMADTLKRAESMDQLCTRHGVRLFVNNRRLMPIYKALKSVIDNEYDSEVITINGWCSSGLHAVGLHLLDLMRFICGDVAWVMAVEEPGYVERLPFSANFVPSDPRVRGLVGFQNGITGGISNTALTNYTYFELEIMCRTGKLRISDNGGLLEVWKTMKPGNSTLSYRLTTPATLTPQKSPLFTEIARSLYEEIQQQRLEHQHPLSARNGLESYRVLNELVQSALQRGKRINLQERDR